MAFNSDTYIANKARKEAWKLLAEARQERADRNDADRVSFLVKSACQRMRMHLLFRREAEETARPSARGGRIGGSDDHRHPQRSS